MRGPLGCEVLCGLRGRTDSARARPGMGLRSHMPAPVRGPSASPILLLWSAHVFNIACTGASAPWQHAHASQPPPHPHSLFARQIAKLRMGDVSPDVMLGRQTLLNCASFHKMGNGCDGGLRRRRWRLRRQPLARAQRGACAHMHVRARTRAHARTHMRAHACPHAFALHAMRTNNAPLARPCA